MRVSERTWYADGKSPILDARRILPNEIHNSVNDYCEDEVRWAAQVTECDNVKSTQQHH